MIRKLSISTLLMIGWLWLGLLLPLSAQALDLPAMSVYRDPNCGCCEQWIAHMEAAGFAIETNVQTTEMAAVKTQLGVPQGLDSCHTALVAGYVLEGHVPAADVERLVTEQPEIAGVTVPGMPMGSPGMEMGDTKDPYNVVSFDRKGHLAIFESH